VVYFAPEVRAEYEALGLRGYWRGYFAGRAAALGRVGPGLVTALFGGFAPGMVARAIPHAWDIAAPEQVSPARLRGAVAALDRLVDAQHLAAVASAAELTRSCLQSMPLPGYPMAAALADLPRPEEPLAALWHDCSVLREYRGDAHLTAVHAAGLVWPEPHLMQRTRVEVSQREHRGWDEETWNRAAERVRGRDLTEVEALTDALAAPAYAALNPAEIDQLVRLLDPVARAAGAELPYPNAMALPPL